MKFPLNFSAKRAATSLWAGSSLVLALAGGCTQNPPGPTIVEETPVVPEAENATEKPLAEYTNLVWREEFPGTTLDASKWTPEVKDVWYNNELQATTNSRENITVVDSTLLITAVKKSYNGRDYTSGRIVTKGHKDFGFGRIDVRAKLPKGKGIWPAIWMLGSNDSQVSWPACGEIDIMELKGSQPSTNITTIHFGNSVETKPPGQTGIYSLSNGDFSTDFHVFSLVRSLNRMRFFVDGVEYFTRTQEDASPYPFNNPFYLILNVAVGGDFDGNPDATTTFPQQMQVDYVRYYKYKE